MSRNNVEQMVDILGTFHEAKFSFDVSHAYFSRVKKILNEKHYSALAEEFRDAFYSATQGADGRKQFVTIWCPWMDVDGPKGPKGTVGVTGHPGPVGPKGMQGP